MSTVSGSQYGVSGTDTTSLVDIDILTKYLAYAKRLDPVLTKGAESKIMEFYLKMRSIDGEDKEKGLVVHEVNNTVEFKGLVKVSNVNIPKEMIEFVRNSVRK